MTIKTIARGVLALIATSIAMPVFAQEQSDVAIFEEILVTATKREQTLQETPVAVSVVTADVMKDSQVMDVKDLQFLVPSLRISQLQTSGNTNFIIRGFGNAANNAGIEPSVAVFIDGVYRSRTSAALADYPNLERIEVLRGPQSTLFGKNASAGVISVITRKPNLDGVEGSAAVTVGEYNQIIVQGDVSGPLSDTVGASISGSYNQRDGYFDNLSTGAQLSELNRYGVRGQLLFAPSDTFELRIIGDYEEMDELCCGVGNISSDPLITSAIQLAPLLDGGTVPGNFVADQPFAYANYFNFEPENQIENSGISAQFDWDLNSDVTLTSITAFRNHQRYDNSDSDFTSADLLSQTAGNFTDSDIDTLTQELRLAGSTDMMDWMVGGFYYDEKIRTDSGVEFGADFRQYVNVLTKALGWEAGCAVNPDPAICNPQFLAGLISNPTIPSPIDQLEATLQGLGLLPPGRVFQAEGQGNTETSGMDNTAYSVFAQFDFNLGDRATLTLGANYSKDEKDAFVRINDDPSTANPDVFSTLDLDALAALTGTPELVLLKAVQFLPPFVSFPNNVENGRTEDDQTTWTARIAYDLTDQVNIYAGGGTGFKASSWNLSRDSRPFDAAAFPGVPNLVSGTRYAGPEDSTVFEIGLKSSWDTGNFNVAVFTQEIEGFQSNIFTGTGFSLANAGKQSTDGIELDLIWFPVEMFQFTFSGTWLDPIYDSFVGAEGPDGPADLSGTKPAGISEISFVTSGQFNFDIGNAGAFLRAEYVYEDEVQVIENVPTDIASREVSTVNASLGMRWDNGFEAMLWGRNLTNDEYLTSAFPATVQPGAFNGYPNQPRTYGLTLRKYFD